MSYYNEAIAKHMYTHMATEGKEEYQKFFKAALKKFDIKSPADLDDAKKKEFFDYIDDNYKAKNEELVGEDQLDELVPNMAVTNTDAYKKMLDKQIGNVKIKSALSNKDNPKHKAAKSIMSKVRDKIKNALSKKKEEPEEEKPKKKSASADAQNAALYGGNLSFESTKEYGKTLDKMASDRKLKNISRKDRELLAKLAQMMKTANEGRLSSKIKKAILIAVGMSGNMTGAVKKIEKMAKGLSDDPKVAAALRIANENINEDGRAIMKSISSAGKGAIATGGGYAPYIKMGRNSWKQKKTGTKSHDDGIFDVIGAFKDFKIEESKGARSLNELDWDHDKSRMASEINRAMKMAGIKVMKHTPYKRDFRSGDAALYGAFIKTKDANGDETILPIEIDKKGIIRYAGGPSKWHPLEIIGALNMSHAKPNDYLKIKSIARTKDYLKQFKPMPGFGQSVLRRK